MSESEREALLQKLEALERMLNSVSAEIHEIKKELKEQGVQEQ